MSRHCIRVWEPDKYWGVVGYDPPLQTFFAIIEHLEVEAVSEDPVVFEVGDCSRIYTVHDLEMAIARYAPIPPEVKDQLRQDKAAARPPSRLQEDMIKLSSFRDVPKSDKC